LEKCRDREGRKNKNKEKMVHPIRDKKKKFKDVLGGHWFLQFKKARCGSGQKNPRVELTI